MSDIIALPHSRELLDHIKNVLLRLAVEGRLAPGDTLTLHARAAVTSVKKHRDGTYTVDFTIAAEENQP